VDIERCNWGLGQAGAVAELSAMYSTPRHKLSHAKIRNQRSDGRLVAEMRFDGNFDEFDQVRGVHA
jgi:hypothetical protein